MYDSGVKDYKDNFQEYFDLPWFRSQIFFSNFFLNDFLFWFIGSIGLKWSLNWGQIAQNRNNSSWNLHSVQCTRILFVIKTNRLPSSSQSSQWETRLGQRSGQYPSKLNDWNREWMSRQKLMSVCLPTFPFFSIILSFLQLSCFFCMLEEAGLLQIKSASLLLVLWKSFEPWCHN